MNIQLDTNVVIDILQERMPHFSIADKFLQKTIIRQHHVSITANSVDNIVFVVRKKVTHERLIKGLNYFLKVVDISPVNKAIIIKALEANWKDLEDAIQYYAAMEANVDLIVTRDKKGYEEQKIKVVSPEEALNIIEAE